MVDTNSYLLYGKFFTEIGDITSIDIVDDWTEITKYNTTVNCALTDISLNANKSGTFRFSIDNNPIKKFYYNSGDYIHVQRNLPFFIPANSKISIEYKASEDSSAAVSCLSGYML